MSRYSISEFGVSKELILLYPAGGKDQESIKEVFSVNPGLKFP